MEREKFLELGEKYIKGECTFLEEKQLNDFFEKHEDEIVFTELDKSIIGKRLYKKIQKSITPKEIITTQDTQKRWYLVAAALVLFICLGFITKMMLASPVYITEVAKLGEKKVIYLPDSSKVILNSGSQIRYPKNFNGKTRAVFLNGESFFEVKHNAKQPFEVKTLKLRIKVLGTSFNVNSYPPSKMTKVSLITGSVLVTDDNDFTKILLPNNQINYNHTNKTYSINKKSTSNDIAWTKNIILLDDHSLSETIAIIERWFKVSITVKNTKSLNQKITGKYKNPKLMDILQSLTLITGEKFEYQQKN